jgi:plasmid stabilization system protein ParE
MSDSIKIIWSDEAKADLKYIHDRILEKTKSTTNVKNIKVDIINASKNIDFIEQYQVDEFLGKPFRRIIVRHFRLVYFAKNKPSIVILEIFDSYRNPIEIRK